MRVTCACLLLCMCSSNSDARYIMRHQGECERPATALVRKIPHRARAQ